MWLLKQPQFDLRVKSHWNICVVRDVSVSVRVCVENALQIKYSRLKAFNNKTVKQETLFRRSNDTRTSHDLTSLY